jgi:hypothetical protein
MLLSEEESRKKVCPYLPATMVSRGRGDDERSHEPHSYPQCIASACMAWRWGNSRLNLRPDGSVTVVAFGENAAIVDPPQPPRRGYCGLSGKPEGE